MMQRNVRSHGRENAHRPRLSNGWARSVALVGVLSVLMLLSGPLAARAQDEGSPAIEPAGQPADAGTVYAAQDGTTADAGAVYATVEETEAIDGGEVAAAPAAQPVTPAAQPVTPADWAPPRTVYVPETGHSIDGVFLDYWRNWGGVNAFGYPITPEFEENGHIVQYYGYARFEYWPEDPNGEVVHLGALGEEMRPAMVRRSLPGFGSAGQIGPKADRQAKAAAKAWKPVKQNEVKTGGQYLVYVEETRHAILGGFATFWEETGGAAYLGNPLTEEYVIEGRTFQVFERGMISWRPGENITLEPIGQIMAERYGLEMAPVGQGDLPTYSEDLFIPPAPPKPGMNRQPGQRQPNPNAEKWIEINLTQQFMVVWQGDVQIDSTYVSTGRPGFDTPPGTFFVNAKVDVQDMEGVIGGEYYNVPNVPWVMYFTDRGHAIHGTYWHNNFGAVMSHGCVNLPLDFAEWLYSWAPNGMRVEIHY